MMPRDPQRPRPASRKVSTVRMLSAGDQCRCACGSMLARVVADGIELKCRKCKSLVLITHDELVDVYRRLGLKPSLKQPIPDIQHS
jgi:phage FluMu protein Com